ncbi:MAG: ABC transporter ATP-binding protein, partial [Chloroflexi bacterium]|nr:ABC transporter ATP-binding protein [Chloroflexota bacterium]
REHAIELFGRVKLPRPDQIFDKYPHEFSGGMRQRVMIAAALVCRPELVIADEPTTALDVTIQAQILAILQELQEEMGLALLFISHNLEVVAQLCDRVVVMYGAQVLEQGQSERLFQAPAHPYTHGLLRSIPRRGSPLNAITGNIFDLRHPPAGCRFHPRCPVSQDRCSSEEPVSRTVALGGEQREVRCHFPMVEAPSLPGGS